MKLHDTFHISYPLPIPDFLPTPLKNLVAYEIFAGSFKSYDMYQAMRNYEVNEFGYIYEVDHVSAGDPNPPERYQMPLNKKVTIFTYIYPSEFEGYESYTKSIKLQYDLLFKNGKIQSAKAVLPTKEYVNELQLYRCV